MANEISVTLRVNVRNGSMNEVIQSPTKSIDQAAIGGPAPGYLTIGTTEETVPLSEISTLGLCYITNHDATNYVDFGVSTGVYMMRAKPNGEENFFRLVPGVTLYAKANGAPCKVTIKVFEN
jgi:hypothetical protein